jgi:hypothetical protein
MCKWKLHTMYNGVFETASRIQGCCRYDSVDRVLEDDRPYYYTFLSSVT